MKSTSPRIVLVLSYLTYLLLGMFNAGIGPVLGELSERTSSSLAAIGGVLTFVFLGSLAAQIAAGPLTDRFGQKPVLVVSLLVLSIGLVGFTSARALPWMFMLVLLTGLGQGGADMGANLAVAEAAPKNSTSALNLLHFFYGLGAFIGPALIGIAIALTGSGLLVHWSVAGLFFVLALVIAALLQGRPRPDEMAEPPRETTVGYGVYRSPLLWLMGAVMLVYVGVEFGLGSWISTYMHMSTGTDAQHGAWVTSAYWAALAIGRLAGAAAGRRLRRLRLLGAALGGSLLGGLGLLASHGIVAATILCLVWIAFSYGTVYPTTVALATGAFSANKGKAVSVLVAAGSMGGVLLPWFAGLLLQGSGTPAYLWFVALSLAVLLIILFVISRGMRRTANAGSS